tara:strand:- start:178 stop:522 length:345 start_codon:yes stop_codon:yes gene_type:complete
MKKFINIREVSELLSIKQHMIRYWDSKISGISTKSKSGTRYFDKNNIAKLQKIKNVLYENGNQNNSLKIANNIIMKDKKNNLNNFKSESNTNFEVDKNSKKIRVILQNMRKIVK